MNSKLFEKNIDLSRCNVFGGGGETTYKYCTTSSVNEEGCTVETTVTKDDKNRVISECEETICPD